MEFVEFMGLKLTMKTREKANYERKHGSPMKEIFKLIQMADVMEKMNEEDVTEIDFSNFDMMSLDFMANIIHASAQRLNANISLDVVYDLIDVYLEEKTIFDLVGVVVELLAHVGYLNFNSEE